jgi:hypothetical protein
MKTDRGSVTNSRKSHTQETPSAPEERAREARARPLGPSEAGVEAVLQETAKLGSRLELRDGIQFLEG